MQPDRFCAGAFVDAFTRLADIAACQPPLLRYLEIYVEQPRGKQWKDVKKGNFKPKLDQYWMDHLAITKFPLDAFTDVAAWETTLGEVGIESELVK